MRWLLITGSTGVLGSEIARIALERDWCAALLIRAKSESEFEEKVGLLKQQIGLFQSDRVRFLKGDVRASEFGLSEKDLEFLLNEVDWAIHSAGDVNLRQRLSDARATAVQSVENLLQLAKRKLKLRRPFQKIEVISTVGVGGPTVVRLPERYLSHSDFSDCKPTFHNTYEQAKFEAEALCQNAVLEGLPLTLHRPSMIIGSKLEGPIGKKQVFRHLIVMLAGYKTYGILPKGIKRSLDLIELERVANFVVASLEQQQWTGKVFNVASGAENAIPIPTLIQWIREMANDLFLGDFFRLDVPFTWIQEVSKLAAESRLLSALPRQVDPLVRIRSMREILKYLDTDQVFSNALFSRCAKEIGLKESSVEVAVKHEIREELLDFGRKLNDGRSAKQYRQEIERFEFIRDRAWPLARNYLSFLLESRCSNCAISHQASPLEPSGLCQECIRALSKSKEAKGIEAEGVTGKDLRSVAPRFKERVNSLCANKSTQDGRFDAVLLFSGGKDSCYAALRLKKEFPKLKLLLLTVDNSFMSPVALENIKRSVGRLGLHHETVVPDQRMLKKLFRHAFLIARLHGASRTVDQIDGDLIHDVARQFARNAKIPLIFSGLSVDQVENIIGLKDFEHREVDEGMPRTHSGSIQLSGVISDDELRKWWWSGAIDSGEQQHKSAGSFPRMLYPFYVWRVEEEEIKKTVVSEGLAAPSAESPLLTNSRLVPLMSAVDFANLGYSSFELEFSRNIRSGHSSIEPWRSTFELAEFSAKTGFLLDQSIGAIARELDLAKSDLGIPNQSMLSEVANWVRKKMAARFSSMSPLS